MRFVQPDYGIVLPIGFPTQYLTQSVLVAEASVWISIWTLLSSHFCPPTLSLTCFLHALRLSWYRRDLAAESDTFGKTPSSTAPKGEWIRPTCLSRTRIVRS